MHLQMALRQASLKLQLERLCFLLVTAVHQSVVSIPTPREVRVCPHHPEIERIVEKNVRQNWADHAPYTKGNFDRLGVRSPRFVVDLKESECCDEW